MTVFLKAATAATVLIGPFVDNTNGYTPETALTITASEVLISKNGDPLAAKSDATAATHTSIGYYAVDLDTNDTDTPGALKIAVNESGAFPVWQDCAVLTADAWDALFNGKEMLANVTRWNGTLVPTPDTAGYPKVTIKDGTGTGELDTLSGKVLLQDGAVTAAVVATGAIDADAIADNAIDAAAIATGAITAAKFAAGAIDAAAIADNAIDAGAIATGAITAAKFAAGAIDAAAIADNAIDAGAIATGAITAAKFAAGAIDAAAIATGAIDADALAADAVDEILDEVVEGSLTMRQVLRLFLASLAGKAAGGGTTTITFRDNADSKNRISATVDASGNRTAVTLDGS